MNRGRKDGILGSCFEIPSAAVRDRHHAVLDRLRCQRSGVRRTQGDAALPEANRSKRGWQLVIGLGEVRQPYEKISRGADPQRNLDQLQRSGTSGTFDRWRAERSSELSPKYHHACPFATQLSQHSERAPTSTLKEQCLREQGPSFELESTLCGCYKTSYGWDFSCN